MFVLCDPFDTNIQKSPLETGYAVRTDGGFVLKCELFEFVEFTYNDYETLQNERSLDKTVGSSLW